MTYPVVQSTSPVNGAIAVSISAYVEVTFNTPLDESTVNATNILVVRELADFQYVNIIGAISYDPTTYRIVFTPTQPLSYAATYRIIIKGDVSYNDLYHTGISDVNGDRMVNDYEFAFTTTDDFTPEPDPDDTGTDTGVVPTIRLAVMSTTPFNRTLFYTGTYTQILFNDDLAINDTGETPYHILLADSGEVLHYQIVMYRSNVRGTSSQYYITPAQQIDYTWDLNGDVLTLDILDSADAFLPYNMEYVITINPGMSGYATLPMIETYQYRFTTQLVPMYATPNDIRFNLGPAFNIFNDEYLYRKINDKSNEIYSMYRQAGNFTLPFYPTDSGTVPVEVRQWVICSVKLDLVRQVLNKAAIDGGSIKLGDFSMSAGDLTKNLGPELSDLENCVNTLSRRIENSLYPRMTNMVPHLFDQRAPWYDRDGRYRHTWKGD